MLAEKIIECTNRVFKSRKVKAIINNQDENFKIRSICSKIIRQDNNQKYFRMIVRVGFDYIQKNQNDNINEDVLVDISYFRNKTNGAETYKVLNLFFTPELPNP